jgi:hypothetical protein
MSNSKDGKIVTDVTDHEEFVEDKEFIEDKEFENKLVRRMDFRIMPLLILLYFLSFLDR